MSVVAKARRVALGYDEAVAKVKKALSSEGFGTLTEIDVQATLEAKLGVDSHRYLIIGACNPALAHRALVAAPQVGVLLPCNVVVREDDDGVVVEALEPALMASMLGVAALRPIAEEASERIEAALEGLGGSK